MLTEYRQEQLLNCCRRAYKPFVDEGYLSFVYGGGEEGKYLCNNPAVDSIHLTGSEATYNAIVWGPGNPKVGLLRRPLLCQLPATTKHACCRHGCS